MTWLVISFDNEHAVIDEEFLTDGIAAIDCGVSFMHWGVERKGIIVDMCGTKTGAVDSMMKLSSDSFFDGSASGSKRKRVSSQIGMMSDELVSLNLSHS